MLSRLYHVGPHPPPFPPVLVLLLCAVEPLERDETIVQLRLDLEASVLERARLRQRYLELQAAERRNSGSGADSHKSGGGTKPTALRPAGEE